MLFSGDHIMEGSTVVIRPPDGDMAAYLEQLERLKGLRPRLRSIAPGHGHLIDKPVAKIDEYLQHRAMREQQIVDALEAGPTTVKAIGQALYPDLIEELVPMAQGTVWAHLRKLKAEGRAHRTSPQNGNVGRRLDLVELVRAPPRRRRACGRCSRPSRPAGSPR